MARALPDEPRVGIVGAGRFVRTTLLPAMAAAGWPAPVAVASAGGRHAAEVAEQVGGGCAARSPDELLGADDVDLVVVATTHDALATTTVAALEGGQHVHAEKPLALDPDQLDAVEGAWRASGCGLVVGFNRRHAEAVRRAMAHLGGVGPRTVAYRVSTGALAPDHWYHDRRQGGRLVGEGCHWIDTATALAGAPVVRVAALGPPRPGEEALLVADAGILLEHADGGTSSISVSSRGRPGEPKERIEVRGGGRTAVVEDLAAVVLDGRRARLGRGDRRGHAAMLAAERRALAAGDRSATASALATVRATHAAAEALLTGRVVEVGPPG